MTSLSPLSHLSHLNYLEYLCIRPKGTSLEYPRVLHVSAWGTTCEYFEGTPAKFFYFPQCRTGATGTACSPKFLYYAFKSLHLNCLLCTPVHLCLLPFLPGPFPCEYTTVFIAFCSAYVVRRRSEESRVYPIVCPRVPKR
jgi:hypothetical protein